MLRGEAREAVLREASGQKSEERPVLRNKNGGPEDWRVLREKN